MNNANDLLWLLAVVGFGLAVIVAARIDSIRRQRYLQQIADCAQLHGLQNDVQLDGSEHASSLYAIPGDVSVGLAMAGVYHGRPVQLYVYARQSNRKDGVAYTVAEAQVDGALPPLLVVPTGIQWSTNLESDLRTGFGKAAAVSLEGDFSKHFTVLTKADQQIPAREILTPDIMQQLLDQKSNFAYEFTGRAVYAYSASEEPKVAEINQMLELATSLANKLLSEAKDFAGDVQLQKVVGGLRRPNLWYRRPGMRVVLVLALVFLLIFGVVPLVALLRARN